MSTQVSRSASRRLVPLLTASTACVLLAVGGPLASADTGNNGGPTVEKHNAQPEKTGSAGNIASTVRQRLRDIASSFDGNRSPVNRPRVTSSSQRIQTPGPGINFGNAGTGNTNFGTNTDPAGINIWTIGDDNDSVANNAGPGINLVHVGDDNKYVGQQSVAPGNFGINQVIVGNNNGGVGNPLVDNKIGSNTVEGTNSLGYNLGVLGNNTTLFHDFGSDQNIVKGDRSLGSNVLFGGSGTAGNGSNEVEGNRSSALNLAFIGDGVKNSVDNGAFGNNTSAVNVAFIGANSLNVGNNNLNGSNLFGGNFAVVGAGSTNSANSSNGVMNFAFVGANSLNSGNNIGGGLNIAFVPPNSTNVGNCSSSVCVNLFGIQLIGS